MRKQVQILLLVAAASAVAAQGVPGSSAASDDRAVKITSARSETDVSTARESSVDREDSPGTRYQASAYVPLDSWIYAAFDRLAAMGYVQTGSTTVRPWTRLECARLLAEAHQGADDSEDLPADLLSALDAEFAYETGVIDGGPNREIRWESIYSRFTEVSGSALRDSFHFGQTLVNDYGRPYGEGGNQVSGVSARAVAGPFAIYLRGEYQYAAAMPTYNVSAQAAIVAFDSMYLQGTMPFGWNLRSGITNRPRFIEAYAAANIANWQISFGQQALWWGPGRSTSLTLSNNAEALPMLRFARVKPIRMPGKLAWVGPVHLDAFFARQGGIHYVALGPSFALYGSSSHALNPPPYLWGVNFSFKPSECFEVGFAHSVIFAGYGRPLNLKTLLHTFSIYGNGQAVDPGKRVTEFNLTYHIPKFRRSLVAYTEALAWDDPVEGKFVARYAMAPGLYVPRLPVLNRMDLRMEGAYTDLPKLVEPAYYYANAHYVEGYTNYGQVMGSWIGRQGRGGDISTSYWFNARNKFTANYRKMTVDKSFLEGGNQSDLSGSLTWVIHPGLELSVTTQYERWRFPLLDTGARHNLASSFEVRAFTFK